MTTNKTSWIQTYTGRKVYPLELTFDQVCVEDIAHALSLKCRFTGHCRQFYSVADHSLRVAALLPPTKQIHGLLHDAAEAYLPDVAGPIKDAFMLPPGTPWGWSIREAIPNYTPRFSEVEDHIVRCVYEAIGLDPEVPPSVRQADLILLATEARDLMGEPPEPWPLDVPVLPDRIEPRSPAQAEADFLAMFHQLTTARVA